MDNVTICRNKAVFLTYSIVDARGEVFEQSDIPIGYIHGANSGLIEKVESALEGRRPGERVEVSLSPAEGFGEHDESLTYTDDLKNVPEQFRHIGAQVEFENDQGETRAFRVSRMGEGTLTLDGNHPLAGQPVTFVIQIIEVRDATLDEIANGSPEPMQKPSLH